MYEKEGAGIIVTTRSRSVYVLERLYNVPLSEKFTNSTEYSVPDKSQVYLISQPRQLCDKIVFEHPVIAVSMHNSFMNGGTLDFVVTDDEVNGKYKYNRLHSTEIEHVQAFHDERRPNVVEDKFSGLSSQSDNSRQQQNYHSNEAR